MKKFFIFILCIIVCLCILNYNNKNATFDIEVYLKNINDNVTYLPLPPSISDFKTYKEVADESDTKFFVKNGFLFLSENLKTLWSFIVFPFKMIWFFITNLKVIFGDLLLWS